ncbi:hypothetical protein Tco_0005275 [Tanacetum coccineum]
MGYQKTPGAGTSGGGYKGYRKGGGYGGYGSSKGFGGYGGSGSSGGSEDFYMFCFSKCIILQKMGIVSKNACGREVLLGEVSKGYRKAYGYGVYGSSCRVNAAHDPYSLDVWVLARCSITTASSNGPSTSSSNNELDYQLTTDIRDMLDSNNPLVSKFRMAGERIRSSDDPNLKLRLIGTRARDGRDHNLPTASEVAALIVGDFDSTKDKRDIILHRQNGNVKRISELHVLYLALQYPLFFPYAEDGYRTVFP